MRYCTFFFSSLWTFVLFFQAVTDDNFIPFFFQSSSGNCACTLVLLFFGHQRYHIIINVSQSKCDYLVFSVFDMEACVLLMKCILLIWQDGWMECTVLCKSTSVFVLMRDVFTIGRFWTIGPTCLLKQRYFSTGSNSCSSLYGMLYNTFFAELSLRRDEQHTLCTIV